MDTGLLAIRLVVGLLLLGHGMQKLLGWFGGHGLAGTGGWFETLGLRPGRSHAMLAGIAEAGGGLLLALGLLTPLACAAIIGVMTTAIATVHWPKVWVTEGGLEYPLVLLVVAFGIACAGPGSAALDTALGIGLSGAAWGLGVLVVGVATGLALDSTRRPATETEAEEPSRPEVRGEATVSSTVSEPTVVIDRDR